MPMDNHARLEISLVNDDKSVLYNSRLEREAVPECEHNNSGKRRT